MLISSSRLVVLSAAIVLAPLSSGRAADGLESRVKEILARPEYKHSRWGLLVVDADSGKPILEHNADQLFAPASVTKLYTCAAALIAFGPDYRFRTPVYRRGVLTDGTLQGDLILVAKGDPTLGGRTDAKGHLVFQNFDHTYASFVSTLPQLTDTDPLAGLRELARQVKKSGVHKVEGDVLIDDRLYAPAFSSGSGPKIITPIMVNDNLVDAIITPGKAVGEPASVQFRPPNGMIQINVQVETRRRREETEHHGRAGWDRSIRLARRHPARFAAAAAHLSGDGPGKLRPRSVHRDAAEGRGGRQGQRLESADRHLAGGGRLCGTHAGRPLRVAADVGAAPRHPQSQPQPVRQLAAVAAGVQARQANAGGGHGAARQAVGRPGRGRQGHRPGERRRRRLLRQRDAARDRAAVRAPCPAGPISPSSARRCRYSASMARSWTWSRKTARLAAR